MISELTGTITKVSHIREMGPGKFLQEVEVTEPPRSQAGMENPWNVQNWGRTREELENMELESRMGEKVKCTCYFNSRTYMSKTHGKAYDVRVTLKNIEQA